MIGVDNQWKNAHIALAPVREFVVSLPTKQLGQQRIVVWRQHATKSLVLMASLGRGGVVLGTKKN